MVRTHPAPCYLRNRLRIRPCRFLVIIAPAEEAYRAEVARKEQEDKINKLIKGDKKTD